MSIWIAGENHKGRSHLNCRLRTATSYHQVQAASSPTEERKREREAESTNRQRLLERRHLFGCLGSSCSIYLPLLSCSILTSCLSLYLALSSSQGTAITVNPASRTIVIHPGSHFTRIGKATDAYPLTIPTVIARRSKVPTTNRKPRKSKSTQQNNSSSLASGSGFQQPAVAPARTQRMDLDENDEEDDQEEEEEEWPTERRDLDPVSESFPPSKFLLPSSSSPTDLSFFFSHF